MCCCADGHIGGGYFEYSKALSVTLLTHRRMIVASCQWVKELESIRKKTCATLIKTLPRNFPGLIEETHENPQGGRKQDRRLKQWTAEHEADVLTSER